MLRIYNSLTRRKENFTPITPGRVNMYVCGITAYDLCHVGHARAQIVFDIIYRYLRYAGYDLLYTRNFTDVDDKIIKKAKETGMSWKDVADKYIDEFLKDMTRLGLAKPDKEPRVSEHIDDIVALINKLIEKGYGYVVNGDVYFEVKKFENYGKLSGKKIDELIAGARIEVDERKRDPLDFALWKSSKPGEPSWDSPWGKGRPGWHIECSTMSMKYLGENFDIHGGGMDLIFPHHENENAQSEAATGKRFANYWIHNGIVTINQEKMSKSLGNIFAISEALERFDFEAIRLFILGGHYRSPLDFSEQNIKESERALERMYTNILILQRGGVQKAESVAKGAVLGNEMLDKFSEFMNDDFNTPAVIAMIFTAVRALNAKKEKLSETLHAISKIGGVLGIFTSSPEEFLFRVRKRKTNILGIDAIKVELLIKERESFRSAKEFAKADSIRAKLQEMRIALEDTRDGTIWRIE